VTTLSHDYLAVVEAAYRLQDSEQAWVSEIARAMQPMVDHGLGVVVYTYDASQEASLRYGPLGIAGSPDWMAKCATDFAQSLSDAEVKRLYMAHAPVEPLSRIRDKLRLSAAPVQVMVEWGIADAMGIRAHNANQRSLIVISCSRAMCGPVHPRQKASLSRAAAHLAAATRLRFAGQASPESADGVLSPSGQLEHASVDVQAARTSLRKAVEARSGARELRKREPLQALELWRSLVGGRWSLVDHVDRDGKRFVLARRNAPNVREPSALTENERAVAMLTAWGHSNRLIAYELGLSPATTSTLLRSAMRKLRVKTRSQLALLFPDTGAR
jgi:DNA-binding CsgD family transcriptional regulator